MKYLLISLLTSTLILVGCSKRPDSIVASELKKTLSPIPTIVHVTSDNHIIVTNTPTLITTPTRFLSTPSRAVVPTQNQTAPVSLVSQCLKITNRIPEDTIFTGRLALGENYGVETKPYLLDMKKMTKFRLPQMENEYLDNFAVSTDGLSLAYTKDLIHSIPGSSHLVITGTDGREVKVIPWAKTWRWVRLKWLNSDQLIINQKGEPYDSLILLNPFTGQLLEIPIDNYPDIYLTDKYLWDTSTPLAFDFSISRLIYPARRNGQDALVLWDEQDKTKIVSLPVSTYGNYPKWTTDGKLAVINKSLSNKEINVAGEIPSDQELYSISSEGELKRLTHLTEYYKKVEILPYSWSPDGRFIAFWIDAEPTSYPDEYSQSGLLLRHQLVVLDTLTQVITNYCIPAGDNPVAPVWSPDSHFIAVKNQDDEGKDRVFVVDFFEKVAIQIAEGVEPMGWMVSPGK